MTFFTLVKQYGKIHKLGKQIIKHKNYINIYDKNKIDIEFDRQEKRIQEFIKLTNDANKKWNDNPSSINKYWTGY